MDKSEIGAHLNGLSPATARGLHNLFNKLLDEIHSLRAQLTPPADGEPEPTSDLLPGAGDKDPVAPPEGSAPIVPLDPVQDAGPQLTGEPPVDPNPEAPPAGSAPIAVTEDGTIIESAGAPADVPPAA